MSGYLFALKIVISLIVTTLSGTVILKLVEKPFMSRLFCKYIYVRTLQLT